ncbi:hypothetical protein TRIUR3_10661 [Triticum urartu]|uniref:GDP-mannose transporter GONST1 n=1 Tax=Triticum urartu TaxID=4572 RepID=M7YLD9_TRIUA|nr:hypothetical protein TRIUR3_10661 [Triticum urartu]
MPSQRRPFRLLLPLLLFLPPLAPRTTDLPAPSPPPVRPPSRRSKSGLERLRALTAGSHLCPLQLVAAGHPQARDPQNEGRFGRDLHLWTSLSPPQMKISRKHLWPELTQCTVLLSHIFSRSLMRSFSVDDVDLEDVEASKDRDRPSHFLRLPNIQNQSLLSGLAYCIASCSMILVNKFVLSGYGFNAGIFLMLYQNIVSVTIVSTLSLSGVISTEPLTWKLIKVWLPVNIIFVGMLITSMFSLKYINVAMLTILKNVANVLTASGETYFFKKQHDRQVWISLMLMDLNA